MSGCPTRTSPQEGFGCAFGETVTADAQGRFRIEAFVPGVETEVSIEARIVRASNSTAAMPSGSSP